MAITTSETARLAEIQEILRSGVVEDEADGQRTKYDHDSLRKEESKLLRKSGLRPVASSINLGGF